MKKIIALAILFSLLMSVVYGGWGTFGVGGGFGPWFTGENLADPGVDSTPYWDDSAGRMAWQDAAQPSVTKNYWTPTFFDPTVMLAVDAEMVFIARTAAALTISSVYGSLDADPTTELDADLYYADFGVGYANETLINTFNTTDGVISDDTLTDGTIPADKKVYLKITAVDAATTQINTDIPWTFDQP